MVPIFMYRDFSVQLFLNFSFQRLLWSLARLNFAARKFPLPFIVAIAAGGGINFVFGLDGVADDGRDNANLSERGSSILLTQDRSVA